MASDEEKRAPLSAPPGRLKRDVARAIVEGVAGFEPVTGMLARLYQVTYPPKSVQDREDWERSITERSNEQDDRLDRHEAQFQPQVETLEGLSARLVEAIALACPNGLAESFHEIAALLPDEIQAEVETVAYDLASLNFVQVRQTLGPTRIRPTQIFYEQFDHQVMVEWQSLGTRHDAAAIAALILEYDEGQTPSLLDLTGWPLRRFNPALAHLQNEHPEWPWRDRFSFDFPTYGLLVGAKEKAGLRRFIKGAHDFASS